MIPGSPVTLPASGRSRHQPRTHAPRQVPVNRAQVAIQPACQGLPVAPAYPPRKLPVDLQSGVLESWILDFHNYDTILCGHWINFNHDLPDIGKPGAAVIE